MSSTLTVASICLIFITSTHGWTFKIWQCGMVFWPTNWEHGIYGPSYDKLTYVCSVTVEPSGNVTSLVDVVGKHSKGKTYADIEVVDIVVSPLDDFTRIPSNIGNLLPKLIGIGFYGEQISSITAEDLKQFPNLNYLAISDTRIVSLDDDLFEYTPNVQALVMPSNKIVSVGQNMLEKLENLKFVDFLLNPCFSYYASTPQQLEWLKSNLTLLCPPATTTSTTTTPTTTTPSTTTVPVADCEIICSPNAETDELKDELTRQGALIRDLYQVLSNYRIETDELKEELINQGTLIIDLYGIMSDYSYRILELEKMNAK